MHTGNVIEYFQFAMRKIGFDCAIRYIQFQFTFLASHRIYSNTVYDI